MKTKRNVKKAKKGSEPSRVRGLLWLEYRRLERRVRLKELTWSQAEELGLCLPRAKSGRKRMSLGKPVVVKKV